MLSCLFKPHTKQTNEITLHSTLKNGKQSNNQIISYQTKQNTYLNENHTLKRKSPQSKTLILPNPALAFAERHTQNRTSSFATNNPQTQMISLWNAPSESYLWNTPFKRSSFQKLFFSNFSPQQLGPTHYLFSIKSPTSGGCIMEQHKWRCQNISTQQVYLKLSGEELIIVYFFILNS